MAAKADGVIRRYERKLTEHQAYVGEHGEDPAEIADWTWYAEEAAQ